MEANWRYVRCSKCKINPTRVPIETKESYRWLENLRQSNSLIGDPSRCVHVGDRESDIYELFCIAAELKTSFLARAQNNRLAGDGEHTVAVELAQEPPCTTHVIGLRNDKGEAVPVTLDVKFRGSQLRNPRSQHTDLHSLRLNLHSLRQDQRNHIILEKSTEDLAVHRTR